MQSTLEQITEDKFHVIYFADKQVNGKYESEIFLPYERIQYCTKAHRPQPSPPFLTKAQVSQSH